MWFDDPSTNQVVGTIIVVGEAAGVQLDVQVF
jgi:hypothetical protein